LCNCNVILPVILPITLNIYVAMQKIM